MKKQFEGHLQAMAEAEMTSKKKDVDVLVLKINAGKLRYAVVDSNEILPTNAKVLDRYSKGNKVK